MMMFVRGGSFISAILTSVFAMDNSHFLHQRIFFHPNLLLRYVLSSYLVGRWLLVLLLLLLLLLLVISGWMICLAEPRERERETRATN
jgi:hypothetical protein